MAEIDDFTDTELWIIRNAVNERYDKQVELMFADSELRLERGSNLVVFKAGDERYHAQFYYKGSQQFGTGEKTVLADHKKLADDSKQQAI